MNLTLIRYFMAVAETGSFTRGAERANVTQPTLSAGIKRLEESLGAYERGVGLYRRCQQALEHAELRVRLLTDPEQPDGAEPFADA